MTASSGKKGVSANPDSNGRKNRNFPLHTLAEAMAVAQKIQDERVGRPMKRVLLADALGISPSSTNFRNLLSSSNKYGLTEGSEKSEDISLTPIGANAVQSNDATRRLSALRQAAMRPPLFREFAEVYRGARLPAAMRKVFISEHQVPEAHADECAKVFMENGRFVEIIRDIQGSPYLMPDSDPTPESADGAATAGGDAERSGGTELVAPTSATVLTSSTAVMEPPARLTETSAPRKPRAIFIAHGRKHGPLEKLQKILARFQIPYKVVVDEPNLARPIPQKVRDVMAECGSAILIFTCDEKFQRENGEVVWRPSENVVYELGAASYAYGDRVVIFKEKGIYFPTNFQSIGYIEFEEDAIEAKWADLLQELIGFFGLVKVTTPD